MAASSGQHIADAARDDIAAGLLFGDAPINSAICFDINLLERLLQVCFRLRRASMVFHPGQEEDAHRAIKINWN